MNSKTPDFFAIDEICPKCANHLGVHLEEDGEHLLCGACDYVDPKVYPYLSNKSCILPPLDETDVEPNFFVQPFAMLKWIVKMTWREVNGRWFYLTDAPTWFLRQMTAFDMRSEHPGHARIAADELRLRERRRQAESEFTPWWADPALYEQCWITK